MKKNVLFGGLILGALLMFSFAGAIGIGGGIECPSSTKDLTGLINFGTCTLMQAVVPLLVALAIVGFVYGIIKYFLNPDNEEKKKEGKSFMLWGLIALFVMVSIWGLVGIFSSSFTPSTPRPVIPALPQ